MNRIISLAALFYFIVPNFLSAQISIDNDSNTEVISIDKNVFNGGLITLKDENGNINLQLTSRSGAGDGSRFTLSNQLQKLTLKMDGNAMGQGGGLFIYDSDNNIRLRLRGEETTMDGGAEFTLFNSDNSGTILIDPDNDGGGAAVYLRSKDDRLMASLKTADGPNESGGHFRLFNDYNFMTAELDADNIGSGGFFQLKDSLGNSRVTMIASENQIQGGAIKVFDRFNNLKIELDGDFNGDGRVITDEIEIKGGSDFAEQFDISNSDILTKPGMLVSIDEHSNGKLCITNKKYDTRVAGIISGANGVSAGVIMYEEGTVADGAYPISLAGRVYAYASDENGKIKPGDLLTSSSTPGLVMKARNYKKSRGAIIGKAMTAIDEDGFVLVLVNLQ